MSKNDAISAVLKFINGRNDSKEYLQGLFNYITDPVKTDNGNLVLTHGCSKKHPLEDILANKKLWHKTHGKQGEHFVLALAPCGENKSPLEVLSVVKEIVATVYPENIAIIAGHTDSKHLHFHVALDAVNAVTGRKFSQGPADLNRVKQKANNILKKHGFEIITASANEFVDRTDYSNEEGFNFLELDDSQFITESTIEEISSLTGSVSLPYVENPFESLDYPSFDDYFYGGYHMTNNHKSQSQAIPVTTPAYDTMPSVVPTGTIAQQEQSVSATVEAVGNKYPNVTLITAPTFRFKCTQGANFVGLGELAEMSSCTQKEQLNAANIALAMNQHCQQNGCPANVAVLAAPIFEFDSPGGIYPPLPEYDDNK